MAITLNQISRYLDNHKLNYKVVLSDNQIITGVTGDHLDRFIVIIQLDEDGEFFKIYSPDILPGVKHHRYKEAILQTLLCISWETKMLQWEYDSRDGEVRAIIEFPLEDGTLTERQFFRCLGALVEIVDTTVPRLRELIRLGTTQSSADSAEVAIGERLLLTIQEEAPGLLDLIAQALESRKQRGQFPLET
ncbi:hypothetical protein L3556_03430 [Candidatus Synechococcus calcipolaris G9]|uniref:YbjN domain-containing protein n=1 Tax=Candidatus Synechococcus calcipolaris G9 TaxID=1497997 RepID=A0ABT6EWX7_9SYNE|nr:hypothetical protein [Candidatus Synechococcus calcipolaris]MDG2989989.1 hypothetical protein [Candidatus Synechococcus calcipolaris G9]